MEENKDAQIYPCNDCGMLRSENQGGKIFTVCDECFNKYFQSIEGKSKEQKNYEIMEREYQLSLLQVISLQEKLDNSEQEKHSYAARFAEWIELEDYVVVSESVLNVFWSKRTESVSKTTSQLLSLFNEHEQDKIEKK